MQKASSIMINLAKNRGQSFVDRFIGFALTIGRLLIICTEIIALVAFLYRFTLDKTLVELHDRITQQEAVVKLLHENEVVFRSLQDRLNLASTLTQQSSQLPKYLIDVSSFAPLDMNIHSIAVASDGIRIDATVHSVDSLTNFVTKIKSYPPVTNVSIDRIDNQTETGIITFSITATLKQPKNTALTGNTSPVTTTQAGGAQ